MSKKQTNAMKAIDEMIHNLKKPRLVPPENVVAFYNKLEEMYDDRVEEIETILLEEIEDEGKFDRLKKISELLEINIF